MSEQTTSQSLTVPLNEDGSIGTLPDPLQKLIDRRISEAVNRVKAKTDPPADPVERERLRQVEAELQQHKVAEAEREKRYEEAIKLREADWQKQVEAEKAERDRRDQKLREGLKAEIRAAAVEAGARSESLAELALLLSPRLGLTETLDPVVLDDKGQPSETTIADLVTAYLDTHPHHRKAPGAVGGGARGGASTRGAAQKPEDAEREATFQKLEQSPDAGTLNQAIRHVIKRAAG